MLNDLRAGRHSWIVVSVVESGVLARVPPRQCGGGGVWRGVAGSASASASTRAATRHVVATVRHRRRRLVHRVPRRRHAGAYRRHGQLEPVVLPRRARLCVPKRRRLASIVVVLVGVVRVRRPLKKRNQAAKSPPTAPNKKPEKVLFLQLRVHSRVTTVASFSFEILTVLSCEQNNE